MKIQLSERAYLEDETLVIQLTKKLLMESLVSFKQPSDSTIIFLKLSNCRKSEVLQSPPYTFSFHFILFNVLIS